MMQLLFSTPVVRTQLGLTDEERQVLKEKTLAVYGELNPDRKPWSRSTRESLESMDPAFADLFARIKAVASESFGIGIASITGREVVQFKGDFVPPMRSQPICLPSTGLMGTPTLTLREASMTAHWFCKAQSAPMAARRCPVKSACP
jgi:hypothetical protein